MSVKLNHTIISVSDREASAAFLVDVLGLAQPVPYGPFLVVDVDNEASLDFMATAGDITSQHYAFLLSEDRHRFMCGVDDGGPVCDRHLHQWWRSHRWEPAADASVIDGVGGDVQPGV